MLYLLLNSSLRCEIKDFKIIRAINNESTMLIFGAMVVVKWSMCSPSIPMIRVQIPLMPTVFTVIILFEKNENKQKRGLGKPN